MNPQIPCMHHARIRRKFSIALFVSRAACLVSSSSTKGCSTADRSRPGAWAWPFKMMSSCDVPPATSKEQARETKIKREKGHTNEILVQPRIDFFLQKRSPGMDDAGCGCRLLLPWPLHDEHGWGVTRARSFSGGRNRIGANSQTLNFLGTVRLYQRIVQASN